jgi:hypothetical protein
MKMDFWQMKAGENWLIKVKFNAIGCLLGDTRWIGYPEWRSGYLRRHSYLHVNKIFTLCCGGLCLAVSNVMYLPV